MNGTDPSWIAGLVITVLSYYLLVYYLLATRTIVRRPATVQS
jgi:hypothetical protein